MELKNYGIVKLEYKRNLEGSINRIIEYKSEDKIFINAAIIKINDIIDKKFLEGMDIQFIQQEDNVIVPIGIINKDSEVAKDTIRFYVINDSKNIDSIIQRIELAIMKNL